MNLDFLKAKIIEKGLTQKEVAEEIGINPKTLNAKLNGREKMTLQDFHKIVKILILNSQELELMVHEMFKARKVIQRSEVWLWLIIKELKDLRSLIAYKLQLSTSE